MAEVHIQDGESLESALRRFKRKVQQEDIIKEIKRHSFYLKPGEKPPVEVDYDLWVGPSAWMEYDPRVFHFNWRWHTNFGGGMVLDWVCHHGDIAAWALGKDAEYAVAVEGKGELRESPWDTHRTYDYTLTYADGVQLNVNSKFEGVKFVGEKGTLFVRRGGQECSIKGLWEKDLGPDAWRCPEIGRAHV